MKIHLVNQPCFYVDCNTFEVVDANDICEKRVVTIKTLFLGKSRSIGEIAEKLEEFCKKENKEHLYLYEVKENTDRIRFEVL